MSQENHEPYAVRLSFRSHARNVDKLVGIAKTRGWLNAKGRPNISKVINYVIEQFDAARAVKKEPRGRRRRNHRSP